MSECYQLNLVTSAAKPQHQQVVKCRICTGVDEVNNAICVPCGDEIKKGNMEQPNIWDEED